MQMFYKNVTNVFCALLFGALLISSCQKVENEITPSASIQQAFDFYVLSNGTQLVKFNTANLNTPRASVPLNGMESAERMLAIDFRPATGQLYGLGSSSRLYIINPETGIARAVSTTRFSPSLESVTVGFDFNPTADRIRVVTSSGQNLRLNPETGTVAAVDGVINGAAGAAISAVAYTNNVAGATTTVLYDIDVAGKKLYKQDPPNNGTLTEVGSLGITDITGDAGFDITPDSTLGTAVFTDNMGKANLYIIDLTNGSASKVGSLAGMTDITGIAVPTNPVAYAVTPGNNLFIFDPRNPQMNVRTITGWTIGESAAGIDFRPLNGQLYLLSNSSRLYTLNPATGVATMVGASAFTPMLSGTSFGFDFNPTVDRIRVVSNTGQNLRLNPETGAVAAVDGNISIAGAAIGGSAYTNNFAGAATTVLYDIDAASDKLYKQDPPNNGTLVEVGALGINVEETAGFDIGGTSGTAYAVFTVGGTYKLYSINLTTGAATALASFPVPVTGLAVGLGF